MSPPWWWGGGRRRENTPVVASTIPPAHARTHAHTQTHTHTQFPTLVLVSEEQADFRLVQKIVLPHKSPCQEATACVTRSLLIATTIRVRHGEVTAGAHRAASINTPDIPLLLFQSQSLLTMFGFTRDNCAIIGTRVEVCVPSGPGESPPGRRFAVAASPPPHCSFQRKAAVSRVYRDQEALEHQY